MQPIGRCDICYISGPVTTLALPLSNITITVCTQESRCAERTARDLGFRQSQELRTFLGEMRTHNNAYAGICTKCGERVPALSDFVTAYKNGGTQVTHYNCFATILMERLQTINGCPTDATA